MAGDDGRCGVAVAVVLCAGRQINQRLARKLPKPALGSFSAPSTALPGAPFMIIYVKSRQVNTLHKNLK